MVELWLLIPRVPGSNLLAAKSILWEAMSKGRSNVKGEEQYQWGVGWGGVGGCFGLFLGYLAAK